MELSFWWIERLGITSKHFLFFGLSQSTFSIPIWLETLGVPTLRKKQFFVETNIWVFVATPSK
jgi:hypothetical protein